VFEPLGLVLRPEVGAISMAGSSVIVALNAVSLKRLRLPDPRGDRGTPDQRTTNRERTSASRNTPPSPVS
jgi:P-type Cu2+ transporter